MSAVTGHKELMKQLGRLAKEFEEAAEEAQEERAGELLDLANEIVPVQSGALRDSGKVEKRTDGVYLVYTEEYAATVHESPNSSGWKWLQRTVDEQSGSHVKRLADLMRGRL